MKKLGRLAAGFCLWSAIAGAAPAGDATVLPELPIGKSTGDPFSVEDYRGQLVTYVFFDDSSS